MLSSLPYRELLSTPLGERRAKSDLAQFSIDLSWAREASDSARTRAYPSPPMSGSPPPPPRRNPDSNDRGQGNYGSSGQEAYRGLQTPLVDNLDRRAQQPHGYSADLGPPSVPIPFPGPYRLEHMPQAYLQYQQPLPPYPQPQHQQQQQQHQHQHQAGYLPRPSQTSAPFPTPDRSSTTQTSGFSSPKQQRKTKGHVASACVPCKRAHLRCDAQRPCSRCLSNGKEDTCIDVQHKKRGRPRLRDERETRYEGMGPGYHMPSDHMRRPLSLYNPGDSSLGPPFGDPLSRQGSYRVLKSQGPMGVGSSTHRHLDYASPSDANVMYGAPVLPSPRPMMSQEPTCAYLNMEMQIVKATPSFGDTIGVQSITNRKLQEIVSPNDREKVTRLQRQFESERRNMEPSYLPPIYLARFEEDRTIQTIGFSPEELHQMRNEVSETFTFHTLDVQQRTFHFRLGLMKKDSTFFIAIILSSGHQQMHYPPPSSPYSRESNSRGSQQYGYQLPQQGYQNLAPSPYGGGGNSPGYGDPRGDMSYRSSGPSNNPGMMAPYSSIAPYTPSQTRTDYPQSQTPYQVPRSELPQPQSRGQHDLQLPPIRDQQNQQNRGEGSSSDSARRRDEQSRVDIGRLLEKPDASRKGP